MLPVGFNTRCISNTRTAIQHRNAPISSPAAALAYRITLNSSGWFSSISSGQPSCTSPQCQTSLNSTFSPAFVVPVNACTPLLNGGSVAMRSMLSESNPRSTGKLSSRKSVRFSVILFLVKAATSCFG